VAAFEELDLPGDPGSDEQSIACGGEQLDRLVVEEVGMTNEVDAVAHGLMKRH
jgi:hypothetical protein